MNIRKCLRRIVGVLGIIEGVEVVMDFGVVGVVFERIVGDRCRGIGYGPILNLIFVEVVDVLVGEVEEGGLISDLCLGRFIVAIVNEIGKILRRGTLLSTGGAIARLRRVPILRFNQRINGLDTMIWMEVVGMLHRLGVVGQVHLGPLLEQGVLMLLHHRIIVRILVWAVVFPNHEQIIAKMGMSTLVVA